MSELVMGLAIIVITFFPMLISIQSILYYDPSNFYRIIVFTIAVLIFWIIGIILICKGIKKIKQNKITDINGEICYGKIIKIYRSNIYVNDRPQLKADFLTYVSSLNSPIIISEVIGYDYKKYKINDLVKLKYYNKDVNIIEKIEEEVDIPSEYRVVLNNPDSLDKAIILID